ncbi:MAG: polyribonucleotide nucleotidyltransferase [Clostridia bacterium]|nr:polyribonucleotide nucleotidyltransferase [Clostridia bacterium]
MMQKTFSFELAGRTITVETGKYAEQAGGSILIRCGYTALLVCATVAKQARDGADFLPLSCDYEEKMYAAGKIPGGFIKREGRPSEKAILTSRLIDRPIRPLFPKGFYNDVQVVATAMSVENDIQPDILAMNGASIALSISEAPFAGPIGAVAVGYVDGEYIINPDAEQRAKSRLALTVAGTKDAVMMVEAGADEVTEKEMLDAILLGHEYIKKIVAWISEIQAEVGKEKLIPVIHTPDEELKEKVIAYAREKVEWQLDTFDRHEREERTAQVKAETIEHFAEEYPDSAADIDGILYNLMKEILRDKIINRGIRPDGRKHTDIRHIWSEVGILPRTHGSAVFTRGQTQVMTIAALGTLGDGQTIDGIGDEVFKRYIHHYNMPPYSTGEVKRLGSPGRREIGHGALAERALLPVIPDETEFPYAIRLVSEVVSSNGSTSQASICGSTLALMDAGVPIKAPVAGCAMGLIKDDETGNIAILTDIQGLEDFMGDMDFKVAGTTDGITAIQMDIKIKGIDEQILTRALEQARQGRLYILDKMMEAISEPREELSPFAPRIMQFSIHPDKIREVIGSGGKTINGIIAETGVKIDIEDDGRVFIASTDAAAAEKARQIIDNIVRDIEVGDVILGKVVNILPIGAQVELKPGKKGLVHISKLANKRVEKVEDVVSIGDEILVRVIDIKPDGKIDLTRKGLIPDEN